MRRGLVCVVMAGALLAVAPSAGGSGERRVESASHCKQGYVPKDGRCVRSRKCRRDGLEPVARSSTARILARTSEFEETYYGCLLARDSVVKLRSLDEPESTCVHTCESISKPRLGGTYAALVYSFTFSYGGGVPEEHGSSVEVYDIRTAKRMRTYAGSPDVLLVAPTGRTVTFAAGDLVLHGRREGETLLDSGSDIAPDSIRVRGREIRWMKGDQIHKYAY